jgi:CBS domain-containing protein
MTVKQLLGRDDRTIITIPEDKTLDEAMGIMIEHGISCLPVLDNENELLGLVSDRDIFRKIFQVKGDYLGIKVKDVMSTKIIVGLLEDEVDYIQGVMDQNWIRHLPIMDGEQIVGIVSQRDIIHYKAKNAEFENRYLNFYMEGLHRRDKSGDF